MKSLWSMALILLAAPCTASNRDHKADLIIIGARFVEVHSRTTHKAGDADEQFIEDVITPSVHAVVDESGSAMTDAQRDAVIVFLLASENSASEEVSEIAATLYKSQRVKLCASIAKLAPSKRVIVLDRVKSGLAATGKSTSHAICP
ncbi:MAG: hypothetical protein QM761_03405 [Pseudoxanthomonas sp.]